MEGEAGTGKSQTDPYSSFQTVEGVVVQTAGPSVVVEHLDVHHHQTVVAVVVVVVAEVVVGVAVLAAGLCSAHSSHHQH